MWRWVVIIVALVTTLFPGVGWVGLRTPLAAMILNEHWLRWALGAIDVSAYILAMVLGLFAMGFAVFKLVLPR
ncbi:hypothetical protein AAMO2058_000850300 [Amorphochlora amoebiformis]